jgi:hypothetical protein
VLLIGSALLLEQPRFAKSSAISTFDHGGLVRLDYGTPCLLPTRARIGSYRGFRTSILRPSASPGGRARALIRLRAVPGAASVAGISAPPVDSFILTTWR